MQGRRLRGRPRWTGTLWVQRVGSLCKPSGCFFWASEFPENQNHPLLSSHRSKTDPLLVATGVLGGNTCARFSKEEVKSRTCGEQQHGHGAVVLLLGPPAERDHSHQEGRQGRRGAGHQQHQGGNLPVCRGKTQAG